VYKNRVYDRTFGDFSAKNTVYIPYTVCIWFRPALLKNRERCVDKWRCARDAWIEGM